MKTFSLFWHRLFWYRCQFSDPVLLISLEFLIKRSSCQSFNSKLKWKKEFCPLFIPVVNKFQSKCKTDKAPRHNNIVIISCFHECKSENTGIVNSSAQFSIICVVFSCPQFLTHILTSHLILFLYYVGERKHPQNVFETELFTEIRKSLRADPFLSLITIISIDSKELFSEIKMVKMANIVPLIIYLLIYIFLFSFPSTSQIPAKKRREGNGKSIFHEFGKHKLALWVCCQCEWLNFINWQRQRISYLYWNRWRFSLIRPLFDLFNKEPQEFLRHEGAKTKAENIEILFKLL